MPGKPTEVQKREAEAYEREDERRIAEARSKGYSSPGPHGKKIPGRDKWAAAREAKKRGGFKSARKTGAFSGYPFNPKKEVANKEAKAWFSSHDIHGRPHTGK